MCCAVSARHGQNTSKLDEKNIFFQSVTLTLAPPVTAQAGPVLQPAHPGLEPTTTRLPADPTNRCATLHRKSVRQYTVLIHSVYTPNFQTRF